MGLCPYMGTAKRLRHDLLFSQYLQVRHEASVMVMKAITINFRKPLCVQKRIGAAYFLADYYCKFLLPFVGCFLACRLAGREPRDEERERSRAWEPTFSRAVNGGLSSGSRAWTGAQPRCRASQVRAPTTSGPGSPSHCFFGFIEIPLG